MLNRVLYLYRYVFYEIYTKNFKGNYRGKRNPISLPAITIMQFAAVIFYPMDILIILNRFFGFKVMGIPSESIVMMIGISLILVNHHYLTGGDRLEKTILEFEHETKEQRKKGYIMAEIFVLLPWFIAFILLFTS